MDTVVAVDGLGIIDEETPFVVADDYGLTRGDGCFDATRVMIRNGKAHAFFLDRHLDRFERSLAGMDMSIDRARLEALISDALSQWEKEGDATLKIIATRGREYTKAHPTVLVTISPLPQSQIDQRSGLTLASLSRGTTLESFAGAPWLLGGVKHLSYAVNMAAKREAARRGAGDALFVTIHGEALEGPNAALVWLKDSTLFTTRLDGTGILPSITQAVAFEGAQSEDVATAFDVITLDELMDVEAAWLLSSIRGITPITAIDGAEVNVSKEWTNRLNAWTGFPTLA